MELKESVLSLDYAQVESEVTEFIRRSVSSGGLVGAVVGLSGGIDSSVVGALCVRALGPAKVVGLLMPASFTPSKDVEDAKQLVEDWGIRSYVVAIDPIVTSLFGSAPELVDNRIAKANARARIRMTIDYYFANMLNYIVAGTGDKSEDLIGYFTKYGDGGVDILPIAHLYKTQVRALGAHLGLAPHMVSKPSSPQLWPGHKATDEIPLDYNKLDLVLYGLFEAKMKPEEVSKEVGVNKQVVEDVVTRYERSRHKRTYPPMVKQW